MNTYHKYKQSGIDWIGEIPEHWQVKKLRYIGNFTFSGIDKKINEGEPLVKIINYTDIYGNSSLVLNSEKKYMEVSAPKQKILDNLVKKGDLIFTPSSETSTEIGLSALVDDELENTSFSYHVIRFQFKIQFAHKFRKYLCNNNFVLSQFSSLAKGTTRQIINRGNFNEIKVLLPPLNEQEAIAKYLDEKTEKIDSLIAKKVKLIELYKEEIAAVINYYVLGKHLLNDSFKENISTMQSTFINQPLPNGWEVKKLKYVAEINSSNVDKKSLDEEIAILLCNYQDVYKNEYINSTLEFMKGTATKNEIERFSLRNKDVLITKDSETPNDIAVPAFVNDNLENVICGYHLAQIRTNSFYLNGEFLYRAFQTKDFNAYFEIAAKGVTRYGLSLGSISDVKVPLPPVSEQNKIVRLIETELNKIRNKIEITTKEIELLQEYRAALISEVVTGKRKVI